MSSHTYHWGESDGRDGVVWPWCRTPKASGGSAHRSTESPPVPHACVLWQGALLTSVCWCAVGKKNDTTVLNNKQHLKDLRDTEIKRAGLCFGAREGWLFRVLESYSHARSDSRFYGTQPLMHEGTSRSRPNHLLPLTEQKGVSGSHRDFLIHLSILCKSARNRIADLFLNS